MIWRLRLICCGRDDGDQFFDDWQQADQFRNEYSSGTGATTYSARPFEGGHRRAGIIERIG